MIFSLSTLWWRRIRGLWKLLNGRDWLKGNLGLVLMSGAMLSKSLIQFSLMGGAVFPPCYFSSVAQSCLTLCNPMDCSTPWLPVHHQFQELLKLMSIELVMPSNHLILHPPLLLLPSIFPSNRVFSNESVLHSRWPKYWRFRFSISPSNEYSELISFTMDWLDLLAVQGLSRVFSNTTVQKHQLFVTQLSL